MRDREPDKKNPQKDIQISGNKAADSSNFGEALNLKDSQFQLISETLPIGIFETDDKGNTLYTNTAFQEILEISLAQSLTTSWSGYLHPDEKQSVFEQWILMLRDFKAFSKDCRIVTANGNERWVHLASAAMTSDSGTRYTGTIQDITERKKAEQEVRANEMRFRLISETLPVGIFETDDKGTTLYTNTAFQEILEISLAESLTTSWSDYLHPDEKQSVFEQWVSMLKDYKGFSKDCRVVTANGKERWVHLETAVMSSDSHISYTGTIKNITKRKNAEQELQEANDELEKRVEERTSELQESEEKFRTLIELSSDWIWETDKNGIYTYVDPKVKHLLGYETKEVIGKSLINFMSGNDAQRVLEFFKNSTEECEPFRNLENTQIRKDGQTIVLKTSGMPFYSKDGHFLGWRGVDTNITDQKQAEEAIQQAKQDAEDANKAKSEFLANMSHEIRTPMNGIFGMTQLLMSSEINSEQHEFLSGIKHSSESLLELIDGILDLSKIEAGKLELETTPFNLRTIVENVTETIAAKSTDKNIDVLYIIDPHVPLYLKGDPGRLRQILINLMGNAVKFTSDGDVSIQIHVKHDDKDMAVLHFEVADTGIGIPKDRLHLIFEPFSQADGSTTRKYGGTGLGLSITKQLIKKMGGEISIDSIEGQGSIFTFTAKFLKDPDIKLENTVLDFDQDMEDISVLVVDDNNASRLAIVNLLESIGCKHKAVGNGDDALDLLREAVIEEKPFNIVLLDQTMPDMTGEETARFIKEDLLTEDTIAFVLATFSNIKEVKETGHPGIQDYLLKPLKEDLLRKTIVSAIAGDVQEESLPIDTTQALSDDIPDDIIVLLVEDHVFNQMVATKFLEKRGCKVILAENGQKAVEAMNDSNYDLVLMDIQMPVMDGYAATEEIRKIEQSRGGHVPIIAMTAHAMKGDREKCLAAGMDDYVAKPIIEKVFYDALDRWLKNKKDRALVSDPLESDQDACSTEEESIASGSSEYDMESMLGRFANNKELFCNSVELFVTDSPKRMEVIEVSLKNEKRQEIAEQAHKLKGSSGYFDSKLHSLFQELEGLGKEGRFEEATGILTKAENIYKRLETSLKKFVEQLTE